MKWIALPIVGLAAFGLTVNAEDRWQITAHLDVFQLPNKDTLSFIPRLSDPEEAIAAFHSLIERATEPNGSTRRVATITARALDGSSAMSHSREEWRYPIEYEQEDPKIGVPMDAPVKVPDSTGYPATTFETRYCGPRFEFSATVHPKGETALLHCTVEHVLFDRWTRYETAVRADGMKLVIAQPVFIDRSSSATVLATPGKPVLLGSYRMSEKEGFFELHVLSTSARRVDLDGIEAPSPTPLAGDRNASLPLPFPERDMRLEFLTFSVSAREATAFRGKLLSEQTTAQTLESLIAQAGSDSVKLIDWQTIPSVAGGRVTTRNERQFRYGIESNQPQSVGSFPPPFYDEPTWQGEGGLEPVTTFEVRFLGTSLEAECELRGSPRAGSGKGVNTASGTRGRLQFKSSNGTFSHFYRWGSGPNRNGKVSYVYQPQFENRSFSGILAIEPDKPLMIRFAKEPGASGRFEIVILRARERDPSK